MFLRVEVVDSVSVAIGVLTAKKVGAGMSCLARGRVSVGCAGPGGASVVVTALRAELEIGQCERARVIAKREVWCALRLRFIAGVANTGFRDG